MSQIASTEPAGADIAGASPQWRPRYSMVDAWRGLASLGVVIDHLGRNGGFDLGHCCVMIFFVISGYCIAAATDSCRRNHVGFAGYMWRRVRRIYPPYFFALCFFTVTRFVKMHAGMGDQLSTSAVAWLQNLTMTQWLSSLTHPTSYAFQNPTLFVAGFWSLNYEEQFYLVMGLLLFSAMALRRSMLSGILLLMIPALIWNLYFPSRSYGFFLEYWVAFALGALVFYRLCKMTTPASRWATDLGLFGLLLFSLYCRSSVPHGMRSVYFEWIVTSSFALVLVALRGLDDRFRASTMGVVLGSFGLISYSLYLTHQVNLRSSQLIADKLIRWGLPHGLGFFVRIAVMSAIAAIFWYFCERPFLNRPLPITAPAESRQG
jgi:peptidoglycan/LPS O-acetylase OafA/YrhL